MDSLKAAPVQSEIISNNNQELGKALQNPSDADVSKISGLTIALYIGSILLLAGVGGLVFSGAKIPGLILLTTMMLVFYIGGILARNSEALKTASHVFVGTGMIMLPFLGFLFYDTIKIDASIIWLIMSLIGVPIYIFAAYVMQNKIFSFFTIAGFISLSCSFVSIMSLAMVWYFVFVMVLGFILEFINLASKNEKLSVLLEPARQSGEWLPLAAFIASLFAITNLREIDFVIILGIAILHQILTYILKPNIGKESILRLILPAWIVLLAHTIVPSNLTIGISLACVAVGQAVLVFSNIIKKKGYKQHRQETECGWLIVIMVCFIVASIYLGDRNITMTWTWVSVALALDSAILLVTRHLLKQDVWALGLLATGIALPIAITSALGVSANNAMTIYATSYLIEMLGLEALFWKNAEKTNDIFTMLSVFILGTASLIAGWNQQSSPIIFLIMAACFLARGIRSRNDTLKEIAVYCAAVGIYRMFNIFNTDLNLNSRIKTEILVAGHVALAGLITSSILFERKNHNKIHTRLLIGCIVVLLSVGIVALNGLSWAMYLFLIETVIILLSGIFIKDKSLRYAGAVGAILAVFWFTKDLSFVWPTLLGLGIISTVVIILIKNNKK